MYTITLADENIIENLTLNGNNYIAQCVIDDSVFEGNLSKVSISDGTTTETYTDMVLIQNKVYGDKSWFILAEKSETQKREEALLNQIAEMNKAMSILLTGKEE